MVIHVKKTDIDQFLFATTCAESNDALIRELVRCALGAPPPRCLPVARTHRRCPRPLMPSPSYGFLYLLSLLTPHLHVLPHTVLAPRRCGFPTSGSRSSAWSRRRASLRSMALCGPRPRGVWTRYPHHPLAPPVQLHRRRESGVPGIVFPHLSVIALGCHAAGGADRGGGGHWQRRGRWCRLQQSFSALQP